MTLRETLDADLKKAMLAKNEDEKNVIRMAKADLLKFEADNGRAPSEEESLGMLQKSVKGRKDAIGQYRAGGRADLVEKEELELAILLRYLPQTMDEASTREAIIALSKELGLTTKKEMGALMKAVKAKHPGIDGRIASQVAAEILT